MEKASIIRFRFVALGAGTLREQGASMSPKEGDPLLPLPCALVPADARRKEFVTGPLLLLTFVLLSALTIRPLFAGAATIEWLALATPIRILVEVKRLAASWRLAIFSIDVVFRRMYQR